MVRYCYRFIWKLLAWKVRNSTGLRIISRSDGATDEIIIRYDNQIYSDGATDKIIIRYDNQIYSDGATVRVTAPPFASPAPSGPPTRATAAHAVPRGKLSAQSRNPAHRLSRPPPPHQPGVSQSLALQRRRHAFCLSRSRWETFPFSILLMATIFRVEPTPLVLPGPLVGNTRANCGVAQSQPNILTSRFCF